MTKPCDSCAAAPICIDGVEQPYGIEVYTADGIFIKEMHIPKAGTLVPQHSHKYDHMTMLAHGRVEVIRHFPSYQHKDVYSAPRGIHIPAGVKHSFISLDDDTVLYCVHNVARTGDIEVVSEHVAGET